MEDFLSLLKMGCNHKNPYTGTTTINKTSNGVYMCSICNTEIKIDNRFTDECINHYLRLIATVHTVYKDTHWRTMPINITGVPLAMRYDPRFIIGYNNIVFGESDINNSENNNKGDN